MDEVRVSILRENGFVSDERGSMARDKAVQKKKCRKPFAVPAS